MASLPLALPSLEVQLARSRLATATGPTLDLFQVADAIVTLLKTGNVAEAGNALDRVRRGRPLVVADSPDRLVAARSRLCFARPPGATPAIASALMRLTFVWSATPRLPNPA